MVKIQSAADAARVIKTQRLRRELTQSDVAEAIGVTRQSYARIEQAHGGASFATYLRVFAFLNIALDGGPPAPERLMESEDTNSAETSATILGFVRTLGQEAAMSALEQLHASGALGNSRN